MNIKRLYIIVIVAVVALSTNSFAAPIFNAPAVRIQPNGDTLHCLLSGDEYYHRLHDSAGYTIVQNPRTGWWVYADTVHTGENTWDLVATNLVAGTANPALSGLHPNLGVDRETWNGLQKRFDVPQQYQPNSPKTSGRNHGTLNNVVIFIRFSDETEISTTLSSINTKFNDSSANATSMYQYFKTVSYNKIHIVTHYYPTPNGNSVISYQDSLPRSYYMPYDATTNSNGYQNDTERRTREFSLLERAVNYVNANSPVPISLNLDMDNDGYVDNICFVVKGTYTGWSDLLWPHKWSLYDRNVYINGKRVYTFNLQLEGSGEHYFSSSTFCHEMFHTLGAPDLYRYDNYTNVTGVGSWDLMCSNTTPPQTMGAYMKWKYGNWIDSIPTITVPGTYTLHSLGDNSYDNCVYKIAAQEPHQWYVFEYRDNTEQFETTLSGKGLLIYRIDDRYNGNANFDGTTVFDEVYLFRPNAPNDTTNGNIAQAFFSGSTTRTQFTPTSNPFPWLTGNVIDTTIAISNITVPGVTISFTYNDLRGCLIPSIQPTSNITGSSASLHWSGNAPSYRVQWRTTGSSDIHNVTVTGTGHTLTGLNLDTEYQWRVRGLCSASDSSDLSPWQTFHTTRCLVPNDNAIGNADTTFYTMPVNNYYRYTYSQMIYHASEIGQAMSVDAIYFNYASNNTVTEKDSCVIYLGHTATNSFSGTQASNFTPLANLTQVYSGPLNFTTGWNKIELTTPFEYNGTDNLVIAIDDNSGDYNGTSYRAYCSNTGSTYTTLSYYSDNNNIDPANPSGVSSTKSRKTYHPHIRLSGCPPAQPQMDTINIVNNNPDRGTVSGDGIYQPGSTVTLSADANTHYNFSYWILPGGDTITTNPYSFVSDGNMTIEAYFAPVLHTVTAIAAEGGSVDGGGVYTYGTTATLTATADDHWHFTNWDCNGQQYSDNPISFTVTGDVEYTAHFAIDQHHITVNVDPATAQYGDAWFTTASIDGRANDEMLDYGTEVTLYAEPYDNIPGTLCTFVGWNDGNSDNPRTITLTQDTVIAASFDGQPVGIDATDDGKVTIAQQGHNVTVLGAEGRSIALYDITGRNLHTITGTGCDTFALPCAGVYILRIEGLRAKKIVRK